MARHRDLGVDAVGHEVVRCRLKEVAKGAAAEPRVILVHKQDFNAIGSRLLHLMGERAARITHKCLAVEAEEHVGQVVRAAQTEGLPQLDGRRSDHHWESGDQRPDRVRLLDTQDLGRPAHKLDVCVSVSSDKLRHERNSTRIGCAEVDFDR
eukprot:1861312-Prymnesium_polylepis.1